MAGCAEERKSPLFQEGLPVFTGRRAPAYHSVRSRYPKPAPESARGSEERYFFFFLPAFFFISALSLLLDLTALVVVFFLAGIDTSS
jgi:hypothetical protein